MVPRKPPRAIRHSILGALRASSDPLSVGDLVEVLATGPNSHDRIRDALRWLLWRQMVTRRQTRRMVTFHHGAKALNTMTHVYILKERHGEQES